VWINIRGGLNKPGENLLLGENLEATHIWKSPSLELQGWAIQGWE
jgi:hypothetical protein